MTILNVDLDQRLFTLRGAPTDRATAARARCHSVAQQAANEFASAESDRSVLIEEMDLGVVTPPKGFCARS